MMVMIERCPECGYELIEEVIFTYPMARYKHCDHCGWMTEEEPDYEDYENEQRYS